MTKMRWPKVFLETLELINFFLVKDEDHKRKFEADGELPPKVYSLSKHAQRGDFNQIFEREFQKTGLEDNPENRRDYGRRLVTDIQKRINRHIQTTPLADQNDRLISTASSFIQFLTEMDESLGANKPDEKYKNQILFKVGLLFAKGEMDKYFKIDRHGRIIKKPEYSAPQIAKELNNESYNKYILATLNGYPPTNPNGNKNIFNSTDMMTKIMRHCEEEKIEVTPYFKSRFPKD